MKLEIDDGRADPRFPSRKVRGVIEGQVHRRTAGRQRLPGSHDTVAAADQSVRAQRGGWRANAADPANATDAADTAHASNSADAADTTDAAHAPNAAFRCKTGHAILPRTRFLLSIRDARLP
jgi:hypothetical protein